MAEPEEVDTMEGVTPEAVISRHIQVTYIVHHSLLNMIDMVAIRKGFIGIQGEEWTEAVVGKLNHIGVKTLKDFVAASGSINRLLGVTGHRLLLHTTLTMMLETVAELVFGPSIGPVAVGPGGSGVSE